MLVLENGIYVTRPAETDCFCNFEISYEEQVIALIRQKYSLDEELAIQRQRDTKPEEFKAYFDYCEECKLKVKNL